VIGARDDLHRRLEHFIAESGEIHDAAVAALAARDWQRFGDVVSRSQRAGEELLGNQVPETIELVRSAQEGGALAASAFGAGFGGSVWALIRTHEATLFLERWRAAYALRFPAAGAQATFFVTRPADAAHYIA
jgi:galactokinase